MNRKKNKEMKKGSVLSQLYENRKLCSKVDEMLDTGVPYQDIIEFCATYDLDISISTLSRYKNKREEAAREGIPLGELIDQRQKNGNIIDIKSKRQKTGAIDELAPDKRMERQVHAEDTLYNDIEFLDDIIQKSFNSVREADYLDPALGMKAVDIKDKVTGNKLEGLSIAGIRELRFRVKARASAVTEVIMSYIPEELHEEVFEAIDEAEREFYENMDITAEGRRISEALQQAGIDI